MVDLVKADKANARLPSEAELANAYSDFMASKTGTRTYLTELNTSYALRTLKHLTESQARTPAAQLSTDDLEATLAVLSICPLQTDARDNCRGIAEIAYKELKARAALEEDSQYPAPWEISLPGQEATKHYIRILSRTARPSEALGLLFQQPEGMLKAYDTSLFAVIIKGFVSNGMDSEAWQALAEMERKGIPYSPDLHFDVTKAFANSGKVELAKKAFDHPIAGNQPPLPSTVTTIIRFCLKHDELDWGEPIFKEMVNSDPATEKWYLILQWAAARGKSPQELERMIQVLLQRSGNKRPPRPDIHALVEYALGRGASDTALEYLRLCEKWYPDPDVETRVLRLEIYLHRRSVGRALDEYRALQSEDLLNAAMPVQRKYMMLTKSLLITLCHESDPEFRSAIPGMLDDMSERNPRLEADTVGALCHLYLRTGEWEDIVDVLQSQINDYGLEERANISDVFLEFFLDPSTDVVRMWDAYEIFKEAFPDTPIGVRTTLMNEFFNRKRSDMASRVFGHMRQSDFTDQRPRAETYVECFQGIAKTGDSEALNLVHNMLKLDINIEFDSRLYNALMLAYMGCDMPYRSLEYWQDILNSQQGPTRESIIIALQACARAPFGNKDMEGIMEWLKTSKLKLDRDIYVAQMGVLAGNILFDEAAKMVLDIEQAVGSSPDAATFVSPLS